MNESPKNSHPQRRPSALLRAAIAAALPLLAATPASAAPPPISTPGDGWERLGGTMDSTINSVTTDGRGVVYAGGQFTMIGTTPFNYLAVWDGAGWSAVGGGTDDAVNALITDSNNNLYAGGLFSAAENPAVPGTAGIAKWDGTYWNELDGGFGGGTVAQIYALAMDGSDNLYAGGYFDMAGSTAVSNVAILGLGGTWKALDAGLDANVNALSLGILGAPTAGGAFTGQLASFDPPWTVIGPPSAEVNALAFDANGLGIVYAGDKGGGVSTWDGTTLAEIGGLTEFNGSPIRGLAVDIAGNLFAAGEFTTISGAAYDSIARWDGTSWTALNAGLPGGAMSVATDRSGNVYGAAYDGVYIDTRRAVAGTPGSGTIDDKQCATFGLAHDPGTGTLASIFGDDIAGDYCATFTGANCTDETSEWAAWRWDAATSAFVPLQSSDTLSQGTGYILCRNAMNAAGPASLKEDYAAAATPVVTTGNCANTTDFPNGCFEIPLVSPAAGSDRYNLAAYPFTQRLDLNRVGLEVDGIVEGLGGTHSYGNIWKLTGLGNSYDADDNYLLPMEAFWVKLTSAAAGKTVKLLVPKP